ncbi:MAG: transglutaminase-like cysteine peptidase [Methylacidiphilales bacterium]|nr:transglutaminase-like cysteine peptidase [Candidatus Methylacidiphilales bacterium]
MDFAARRVAGAVIFSMAVGAGGFAAASPLAVTRLANPIPKSTAMVPGGAVLAPVAAVRFCLDNSEDCRANGSEAVELTQARWAELESVNRSVNERIRPRPDSGLDTWSLGAAAGDCDDYAVQKRHDLIVQGWPGRRAVAGGGAAAYR